jgi:hypothetical protein
LNRLEHGVAQQCAFLPSRAIAPWSRWDLLHGGEQNPGNRHAKRFAYRLDEGPSWILDQLDLSPVHIAISRVSPARGHGNCALFEVPGTIAGARGSQASV